MNKFGKIAIVLALALIVGIVLAVKSNNGNKNQVQAPVSTGLPRIVDLGSVSCIPCKMMAPILEELRKEQQGRLTVEFIDVWEKPDEGQKYKIQVIPTQIFFDASGKELWRHEGFISKQDILAKWTELGFDFEKGASRD